MSELKRAEILVDGFVQMVGYRFFTSRHANSLRLKGYVRNLYSGEVEVVAEGEEDRIKKLIRYLRKGPHSARVDKVEVKWGECQGKFNRFSILGTSYY
jgi:acylphosphatase